MKPTKFIPLVLSVCLVLAGCGREDAQLHKQVVGNWAIDKLSLSFLPDGTFTVIQDNSTNTSTCHGVWIIKKRVLICTITNSDWAEVSVGTVQRDKIVRVGERSMIINDAGHRTTLMRKQ